MALANFSAKNLPIALSESAWGRDDMSIFLPSFTTLYVKDPTTARIQVVCGVPYNVSCLFLENIVRDFQGAPERSKRWGKCVLWKLPPN